MAAQSTRCGALAAAAAIGAGSAVTTTYLTLRSARFDTTYAYNLWFMPPSLYVWSDRNHVSAYITNVNMRGVVAKPLSYTKVQLTWDSKTANIEIGYANEHMYKEMYNRRYISREYRDTKSDD